MFTPHRLLSLQTRLTITAPYSIALQTVLAVRRIASKSIPGFQNCATIRGYII